MNTAGRLSVGRTQSSAAAAGATFNPEATDEACTAAVLLDVDPVGIVRGRGGKGGVEDQYVNDRPYVASSLLSVVLSRWFNSALGGCCERKPELAASELPLEALWPWAVTVLVTKLSVLFGPKPYEAEKKATAP